MSTEIELLKDLNQDIKELQVIIETKPDKPEELKFDDDNDADDDLIIDILEQVEDIDDEYRDDDDDDDKKVDDDISHITDPQTKKEMRKKFKALRVEMKTAIKELKKDKSLDRSVLRQKIRDLRKNFRKQKRSNRQSLRVKLRSERKLRRQERREKRLSQGQRSGIVRIFRSIISKVKDTLINVAIKGLQVLSNKMDDQNLIKPYVLQVIKFLEGLKLSGLSNESTTGESWSEDSTKVDQFVSKVKDTANNIKINARITLNEIFKKVLEFLSTSKSPIIQILTVVLTPFLSK